MSRLYYYKNTKISVETISEDSNNKLAGNAKHDICPEN